MKYICSTHYRYNDLGELTAEGHINNPANESLTDEEIEACLTRCAYNSKGNLVQKNYPSDSTGIIAEFYEYNDKNQLTDIKANIKGHNSTVTLATYTYTSRGMLESVTEALSPTDVNSEKIIKRYGYNELDLVTGISYEKASDKKVFESYDYTYDKNLNIISETVTGDKTEEKEYTYNSKNQLIRTDIKVNGVKQEPYIYEYDAVGNCITMTNGYTENMKYNGLNQLTQKVEHTGIDITTTYTYDKSGNQTRIYTTGTEKPITHTLTYDPYNRLTSESRKYGSQSTVTRQKNTYNGDGQRIASTQLNAAGSTVAENYYYSNGQLSYVTDSAETVKAKYIYNTSGGVILREENTTTASTPSYIHYTKDIRGSARTLLSQTGKSLIRYSYNDYGSTGIRVASDNTSKAGYDNHLCYTGGVYDKGTGMYYLNARYYNPANRSFITQDTYRGTKEDPLTWNLYAYCAGNPIGYTDPTGHFLAAVAIPVLEILAGATLAGVTIGYICSPGFQNGVNDVVNQIENHVVESVKTRIMVASVVANQAAQKVKEEQAASKGGNGSGNKKNNKKKIKSLLKKLTKKDVNEQLDKFDDNKIKHIINGSKKHNHHWEWLVKNKKWSGIKKIICEAITTGTYQVYGKETHSVVKTISGHIVRVTFGIKDGIIKVGNAWVE